MKKGEGKLNSEFQDWFGITEDGQRGWKEQGADTVNPFKGSHLEVLLQNTDSATSETHYSHQEIINSLS